MSPGNAEGPDCPTSAPALVPLCCVGDSHCSVRGAGPPRGWTAAVVCCPHGCHVHPALTPWSCVDPAACPPDPDARGRCLLRRGVLSLRSALGSTRGFQPALVQLTSFFFCHLCFRCPGPQPGPWPAAAGCGAGRGLRRLGPPPHPSLPVVPLGPLPLAGKPSGGGSPRVGVRLRSSGLASGTQTCSRSVARVQWLRGNLPHSTGRGGPRDPAGRGQSRGHCQMPMGEARQATAREQVRHR